MNKQDAERITTEYLKPVYGFALKRCRSLQDAEDLSQDIVLRIFTALLKREDIVDVQKYVWTIALNITSMILGIVGYLAIALVMWGGIQYITAQGDVSKTARGKKTVTNSIIGLIIVMSASIVSSTVSGIISKARDNQDFFLSIFNDVFFWAGVITCIMIVWGGIQYITSTGNPQGVVKAKNTILYSAIGLIIVIFAATIVNTVVRSL